MTTPNKEPGERAERLHRDGQAPLVSESPWVQAKKRFFSARMGPLGLSILAFVILFVIVGSIMLPYDFYDVPIRDENVFAGRPPAWGRP